jgi:hypothetical protein
MQSELEMIPRNLPTRDLQREQVERCSRMYKTNKFAADAMGVSTGSFSRMCKRYSIESPNQKSARIATTGESD